MLTDLRIQDLATIADLTLEAEDGFNVLTGETGAGKSIVVVALSLLLGQRASRELVRTGCDAATVTGRFDLSGNAAARAALEELGLEAGPELVVKRSISREGRHRVRVNGDPATLTMLATLAPRLGAIHGQHESQDLLEPAAHLALLDAVAGLDAERGRVRALREELSACLAALERLAGDERERARRRDLLAFQVEDLEAARLPPAPGDGAEDEDVVLRREHAALARAEELADIAREAAALLYADEDSASARVARARRRLDGVAGLVPELDEQARALVEAQAILEEAGRSLGDACDGFDASPARLQSVEARRAELERIQRKYGPGLDDCRAHLERARRDLEEVERWDDRREEAEREVEAAARAFAEAAVELSTARGEAASDLHAEVEDGLARLGMRGTTYRLELERVDDGESPVTIAGRSVKTRADGIDHPRVLFSANAGEAPRPLARVASGGELSRLMLVLSALRAARRREGEGARTWVFDEVDAGVGGEAALEVGARLAELASAGDQVFCVTHLPQVAAAASIHHRVTKQRKGRRTETALERLDGQERTVELARMLSGRETAAARRHAEELLASQGVRGRREASGGRRRRGARRGRASTGVSP